MEKVTKILVPIDYSNFSENAFRYALLLADRLEEARIVVLHVVYPDVQPLDFPTIVTAVNNQRLTDVQPRLKNFVDKGIAQVLEQVKKPPMVQFDIELGTPATTIAETVVRDDIDLVVMGTRGHKRSGTQKILGSVTTAVLEKVGCAVMVIPEEVTYQPIKKIAYATDVNEADPFELWKSMDLLESPQINASYHIVHVNLKKEGDIEAGEKMRKMLRFYEKQVKDMEIKLHHLPGQSVENRLNKFIEDENMDMLIMYKPEIGWWNKLFHKSVTKKMALSTTIPTLIMKD